MVASISPIPFDPASPTAPFAPRPGTDTYRRVLTIAGSDCGGGAGIQADLKTFHALGAYGMSVLTALTAQNTRGVQGIFEVEPSFVAAQLNSIFTDIGCDAAKTGMLSTQGVIEEVAWALREHGVRRLVVDPVMVAKGGARLLREEAIRTLVAELLPLCLVATPNAEEAAILAGRPVEDLDGMKEAARRIRDLGPRTVLVKGGHVAPDEPVVRDVLLDENDEVTVFESSRVAAVHTHGTGCTLSAAIAAHLARGRSVAEAVAAGREFLNGALKTARPLGGGIGPVNHLWKREATGR